MAALVACGDDSTLAEGTDASSSGAAESTSSASSIAADSSSSATPESSSSESSSTGTAAPTADCGNGVLEFGEDCDDAKNGEPDDGCTDACKMPACGDAFLQASLGEECDGGPEGDAYCTAGCTASVQQSWLREYGDGDEQTDDAEGVAIDGEGNVIVVGTVDGVAEGAIGVDLWVRKYSPAGDEVWTQTYDSDSGNSNDRGAGATVDPEGNVYAIGETPVAGQGVDALVISYDASGVQRWATTYHSEGTGFDGPLGIAHGVPGVLLVSGYAFVEGANDFTGWYAALDPTTGALSWSEVVAGDGKDALLYDVAIGSGGEFALVGVVDDDAWIRVVEADGTERWTVDFDVLDGNNDSVRGVGFTAEGDVVVAGSTTYLYARRFSADGDEQWSQAFGYDEAAGADIDVTSDGLVVVLGEDSSLGKSGFTPVLLGLRPDDGTLGFRTRPLGSGAIGLGQQLAVGPEGSFAAVGSVSVHAFDGDDLWAARYVPAP